ncbi:MAG: methyltransferase domain-containing protein [Ignavibacteriae bacterium]|nr:methyltransferase domain-containing protein [Ignavibacteriota bacterium]MCB9215893.1 methyltransferase domain-containing protein [Ignavibacteria bacterium]
MTETSYIIKGGDSGADRLRILGEATWPSTERLLNKLHISSGMHSLDFGCGGGDVSVKLAQLVGPSGSVTGIDMDSTVLERARGLALENNVSVEFLEKHCEEFDEQNRYDVAYARFILSHLTDPHDALRRMKESVKPGGWVVAEDIDIASHLYYPDNEAVARYVNIYEESARYRGADPNIGPKLVSIFVEGGIRDPEVNVVMPTFRAGPGKSIARITLRNIADTAIEAGITTREEVDDLLEELSRFEADPTSIISTAQIIQVWGRRPT